MHDPTAFRAANQPRLQHKATDAGGKPLHGLTRSTSQTPPHGCAVRRGFASFSFAAHRLTFESRGRNARSRRGSFPQCRNCPFQLPVSIDPMQKRERRVNDLPIAHFVCQDSLRARFIKIAIKNSKHDAPLREQIAAFFRTNDVVDRCKRDISSPTLVDSPRTYSATTTSLSSGLISA